MIKTIITEDSNATAATAASLFSDALKEPKTTFLVYRSTAIDEKSVESVVERAARLAKKMNEAEWRVIWIKQQDLVRDIVKKYFGDDDKIAAVSLCKGTGEPRTRKDQFELSQISDNLSIGDAFSGAGVDDVVYDR